MHKIILGDNQAIFRTGTAKVLTMEDDLRIIAQCPDCPRLYHAIATFRGTVVLVASSLRPDFAQVLASCRDASNRLIMIAENGEPPPQDLASELDGLVYRNVAGAALIDCVRRVTRGERTIHPEQPSGHSQPEDLVGARVRDRLTPKEMKIVALIVQGYRNKEIGQRLGTTEQVIKNYLRSIYDKTGVSDRLELALFTIHHRTLAEAATSVGNHMGLSA
jgi:DNA-binding NarL/FixJ family response regulator